MKRAGSVAAFLILLMSVLSAQTLTCGRNQYEINGQCCAKCQPGGRVHADCTEDRRTHCLPCPEGTFMNQTTSRTVCYRCSECDEASGLKMKMSCSIVLDSVCEPLGGFYCSEFDGFNCYKAKRHRRCAPGQYINKKGTSSTDTECSTCPIGTFLDGTFPSCQNHTQCLSEGLQLLRAGTKTEDAQCGGRLSVRTGLIVCVGVGGVILLFIGVGLCYSRHRRIIRRNRRREIELSLEGVKSTLKSLKSEESE